MRRFGYCVLHFCSFDHFCSIFSVLFSTIFRLSPPPQQQQPQQKLATKTLNPRNNNKTIAIKPTSGGFQLSPDFRQRASSNASSIGRLSPIPAIVGLEPDWGFANGIAGAAIGQSAATAAGSNSNLTAAANAAQQTDYAPLATDTPVGRAQAIALDQLAGSLADELSLQKDFMQGSVSFQSDARISGLFGFGCLSFDLTRFFLAQKRERESKRD